MKPFLLLLPTLALASALTPAMAEPSSGGHFRMDATVIGSGGSTASGGRFRVEATVGEPATEKIGGGSRYQLAGGFWTPITVTQTPGAPELKIELLPDGSVRLSWPLKATGYVLQGNEALIAKGWLNVQTPVTESATEHSVTVSATDPLRCYRLWKQ